MRFKRCVMGERRREAEQSASRILRNSLRQLSQQSRCRRIEDRGSASQPVSEASYVLERVLEITDSARKRFTQCQQICSIGLESGAENRENFCERVSRRDGC